MAGRGATPVALEDVLARVDAGEIGPAYLVVGDLVVAEPAAERLSAAVAAKLDCTAVHHRRPADIGPFLEDLKTFSLFEPAKVLFVLESGVLADASAASDLLADAVAAAKSLSGDAEAELDRAERRGASRLLQVIRLLGIEVGAEGATEVVARIPDAVIAGRGRGRRRKPAEAREGLARLLERAWAAGLTGWAETPAVELAELLAAGFPEGHVLVMAESLVAADHPLVEALQARGALVSVGQVSLDKKRSWQGLEALTRQLADETGVAIAPRAAEELARRTLRTSSERGARDRVEADSTARFAAEYRKLAGLSAAGAIDVDLVQDVVEDRGREDVWEILDAIGRGDAREALRRVARFLASADDEMGARLSLFTLLADYARQLAAVGGAIRSGRVPGGESNYRRFKDRLAPRLQAELATGRPSPVARLHPFRLHRAYLAASQMSADRLRRLPSTLLEAELQMKGESAAPHVALADLVAGLAERPGASPGRGRRRA